MTPPTFPSLEQFKRWYEREFIYPRVVVEKGDEFEVAVARYYNRNDDRGLLACALNVWARLQRDHEKVLDARCQEYEKGIAGLREDVAHWKKLYVIESDDAHSGRNAIQNLTRENDTLRLGAARKEFGHDYDVACKKLDDQNVEINELRKAFDSDYGVIVAENARYYKTIGEQKGEISRLKDLFIQDGRKYRRPKKLRAFGRKQSIR